MPGIRISSRKGVAFQDPTLGRRNRNTLGDSEFARWYFWKWFSQPVRAHRWQRCLVIRRGGLRRWIIGRSQGAWLRRLAPRDRPRTCSHKVGLYLGEAGRDSFFY